MKSKTIASQFFVLVYTPEIYFYHVVLGYIFSLHQKLSCVSNLRFDQSGPYCGGLLYCLPLIFIILFYFHLLIYITFNRICGIMVSVLASSVVNRGFEPRTFQTKDYKIGICCFSAKHAALKGKSKDCQARNQNNVFEQSDMSIRGLLFL